MYMSSCYQASITRNSWYHAEQDCKLKGAHLATFNEKEEEVFVVLFSLYSAPCVNHKNRHLSPKQNVALTLGPSFQMWIGLRVDRSISLTSLSWVDGTKPTYV